MVLSDGGPGLLSLSGIRPSIGTQNPVPEKMDHRKITVRVTVMDKVQLLPAPKPCKLLKPRSFGVIFLIEKDMGVERCHAGNYHHHKKA